MKVTRQQYIPEISTRSFFNQDVSLVYGKFYPHGVVSYRKTTVRKLLEKLQVIVSHEKSYYFLVLYFT